MMSETETLDKLYLEWSQFTRARTQRELFLIRIIEVFALDANWRRDGRLDATSGNFDGIEVAKNALLALSRPNQTSEAK